MRNGWGWMAGIGAAGLLVAGAPAYAGDKADKAGSTGSAATQSERDATLGGSGSMGTTGSDSSTHGGAAGTTDPSMGSSGTMGSTGAATTPGAEHHAGAMGSASQNQVTGKVDKFDRSSNELTLSLKVSESTQVKKDGQQASLSDIQEGDQVRASFSGSGESLQVTEIEVMSSGASSTGASDLGTGGSTGAQPGGTSTGTGADTGLETPSGAGSTGGSPSGSSGSRGY